MANRDHVQAFVEVLRDPKHHYPDLIAFDMGDFGSIQTLLDLDMPAGWFETYGDTVHQCGTICCAIGLAGYAEKTRALGITQDDNNDFFVDGVRMASGFQAASVWLDIPFNLAAQIFSDNPCFYHANGFTEHSDVRLKPEHVIRALHALNEPDREWIDRYGVPVNLGP